MVYAWHWFMHGISPNFLLWLRECLEEARFTFGQVPSLQSIKLSSEQTFNLSTYNNANSINDSKKLDKGLSIPQGKR